MVSNSGYALLIGIDHYSRLGESAELLGSRNDVLMWHWFCRQHLGIPAENIRMLTSPALDPNKDFGGDTVPAGTVAEATEKAIREGYAWLLANLKGGQSPGLLSYSGHGLLLGGKVPALSTSDMLSDGTGAIALRDIGKAVQDAGAQQALTAVFDCCHVAAPSAKSDLRRTTSLPFGAADAASIDDEDFNVSHRVFLAARPGQEAHQGKLGRSVHGALSFALVTAAEQWKASQAPGQTGLDVNHKQLFKRARKLVRALRMKQSLKLRVPFDRESRSLVRKMPFFGLHPDVTARKPDSPRRNVQTDPGLKDYRVYTITGDFQNNGGTFTGYVLVPNATQPGSNSIYQSGNEYWYVPNTPSGAGLPLSLTFNWEDHYWGDNPSGIPTSFSGYTLFTAPQPPSWRTSLEVECTKANAYVSDAISARDGTVSVFFMLAWDLGASSGSLNWYVGTTGSSFGGTVFSSFDRDDVPIMDTGIKLTSAAGQPSGYSWNTFWSIGSGSLTGVPQT